MLLPDHHASHGSKIQGVDFLCRCVPPTGFGGHHHQMRPLSITNAVKVEVNKEFSPLAVGSETSLRKRQRAHSYDARKALQKNGIQLSSGLIVGVKSIDPVHRQQLDEIFARSNQGGFMVSLPSKSFDLKNTGASNQLGALPRPYDPKANTNLNRDAGRRATSSVAAPAKSIVTNVMDLIFGI